VSKDASLNGLSIVPSTAEVETLVERKPYCIIVGALRARLMVALACGRLALQLTQGAELVVAGSTFI
jgi:hypothetical protein